MKIETLQWNIGGGKIREQSSDPGAESSYVLDGMGYMADLIKKLSPAIITLVETHANNKTVQAEEIANALGYGYWVNDVYDQSHIEAGMGLGQAIVSRFPISSHDFSLFYNPKFETVRPNGEKWVSHNKGLTTGILDMEGKELAVMTLHLIPFRKFGVPLDDQRVESARKSIVEKIKTDPGHLLLQGDFNVDDQSLKGFLPEVMGKCQEVLSDKPTTPKGRRYDHVVYKGMMHIKSEVIETLTDHFPVYSEFEVN